MRNGEPVRARLFLGHGGQEPQSPQGKGADGDFQARGRGAEGIASSDCLQEDRGEEAQRPRGLGYVAVLCLARQEGTHPGPASQHLPVLLLWGTRPWVPRLRPGHRLLSSGECLLKPAPPPPCFS